MDYREFAVTSCNFIPRITHNVVERDRLIKRLNDPAGYALTVVVAPAGFGKTTLLTSWLKSSRRKVAWFSIEDRDDDLEQFVRHIITAFRQTIDSPTSDFGALWLKSRRDLNSSDWKGHAALLFQEMIKISKPITLILDDYQFAKDDHIHRLVIELIDKLPDNINIILASRTTPPLPLSKLRARGLLSEINVEQLRFTQDESQYFLGTCMDLKLSSDDLTELHRYAEGWIVGIQLAAIGIQEGATVEEIVQSSHVSNRHSLIYLLEEVLHRQHPEIQSFLIKTSVLDKLNVSLCDHVAEVDNSNLIIDQLQNENLFIVRLDPEGLWYRFHPLFRSLLREQLTLTPGVDLKRLHTLACDWYTQHEMANEAIVAAVAAEDWERVVTFVRRSGAPAMLQARRFREWLKELPAEAFQAAPELAVYLAWSRLMSGNVRGCQRIIDRIDSKISYQTEEQTVQVHLLRAAIGWFTRTAEDRSLSALKVMESNASGPTEKYLALSFLGFIHSLAGRPLEAKKLQYEAIEFANQVGSGSEQLVLISEVTVARSLVQSGQLTTASRLLLDIENRANPLGILVPINGSSLSATIHLERNELRLAEQALASSCSVIKKSGVEFNVPQYYETFIWLKIARNEFGLAQSMASDFSDWCRKNGNSGWAYVGETLKYVILALQGRHAEVEEWLKGAITLEPDQITYLEEPRYLLLIRSFCYKKLSTGGAENVKSALLLADRLRRIATDYGRIIDAETAELAVSILLFKLGRIREALSTLDRVGAFLLPEGCIRPFLYYREALLQVIDESSLVLSDYQNLNPIKAVLEAETPNRGDEIAPESIRLNTVSDREQEILNLLAIGLTNAEIASNLTVSLNTVKTHIKSIYFKLDVHSRTQAIAAARSESILQA